MMNVAANQTVRTELRPGEMVRYGGPVHTSVNPSDLMPHGQPPRTTVSPEDFNSFNRTRNTTVRQGDLDGSGGSSPPIDLTPEARHKQLTHQTERLVSQTFFGTLLKQMRDSPFKSELFSGGRGGEAFSTLYDQHLADRMAHAAGRKLVRSIVKHIERTRTLAQSKPIDEQA